MQQIKINNIFDNLARLRKNKLSEVGKIQHFCKILPKMLFHAVFGQRQYTVDSSTLLIFVHILCTIKTRKLHFMTSFNKEGISYIFILVCRKHIQHYSNRCHLGSLEHYTMPK